MGQALSGKTAIVTGAASARGLGKATARMFADHGARVAILDLDEGKAQAAAAEAGVAAHWIYKADDKSDATPQRRAREWLSKGVAKDPRLKKDGKVGEAFLCFLPFFRVQADCIGFALGTGLVQNERGIPAAAARRPDCP